MEMVDCISSFVIMSGGSNTRLATVSTNAVAALCVATGQ